MYRVHWVRRRLGCPHPVLGLLLFQLLAGADSGKQQVVAHAVGSLPPASETPTECLAPGLASPSPDWGVNQQMGHLFVSQPFK